MIRQSNNFGINFSEKAVKVLQVLGYVRGDKKVHKDKNLSKFISNLVEDFIVFHPGLNEHEINLKVHLNDMNELGRQRDALESKMREIALKVTQEREMLKSKQEAP